MFCSSYGSAYYLRSWIKPSILYLQSWAQLLPHTVISTMNEWKKITTEYKAHGFKDRKYSNKQDYQAWLEDFTPCAKALANRAGTGWERSGVYPWARQRNTRIRVVVVSAFNTKMSSSLSASQSSCQPRMGLLLINLPKRNTQFQFTKRMNGQTKYSIYI